MRYLFAVRCSLTVFLLLGARGAASADPIRITQDSRVVTAVIEANGITQSKQAIGQDMMSEAVIAPSGVARASLTSSIANPLVWFGFGVGDVATATQGGTVADLAEATFGVGFDVVAPLAFTFVAEFAASTGGTQPDRRALWRAALVSGEAAAPRQQFFFEEGGGPAQRLFTGLLTPGQYFLEVSAENIGRLDGTGSRSGNAAFDFNFVLAPTAASPTPEPASLLLLGTGILPLFRKRIMAAVIDTACSR